ncbi:hypothetical protein A3A76_03280 [Candidatus Woesebacteria bacterium RIFCSPLOWO2_01_FULL_39_23]|uniref:DNA-deoxyinosine glycosylase n=1 Tax=Candidatus Woesebacteria bacterium RIFCSPHIGHO2_01_FULL_40_22 TaxID=1802499 RepID=A0A1F7YJL7_9BACT|nr:MAG: hypothetical protein A2141_00745 [Candidatus Woesebacteria bacterium RBG_16_40_11]OGM27483.1 MAG: hypothetical protein A2628_01680 [Candidatus Woesebacteria bacterium RIFCSPHIGHO2_01_FULL_40_22]OGM36560.1 MAG: hypothetical protein A3E41_03965 [Candidatus Woesebacteria bacterium RIFCSPHIGHO2_12_FULL_38_9]OGM62657.1 MAG: hypothetical protein A3A76_03280 [Candidatus Woesebacteria bacterium RIFCSPLOWO2_01_FULL_39_23]
MIETHPLLPFVPPKTKYLLLGSFVTKEAFDNKKRANYTWYYANGGRNQFWPMLQDIYDVDLQTRKSMQNLMAKLHMAVADIIYRCERKKYNNLDTNLINIVYNIKDISKILRNTNIEKIYFSSRFVESKFRKLFKEYIVNHKEIELITLPSPSPRYASLSKEKKVNIYKKVLPKL